MKAGTKRLRREQERKKQQETQICAESLQNQELQRTAAGKLRFVNERLKSPYIQQHFKKARKLWIIRRECRRILASLLVQNTKTGRFSADKENIANEPRTIFQQEETQP